MYSSHGRGKSFSPNNKFDFNYVTPSFKCMILDLPLKICTLKYLKGA